MEKLQKEVKELFNEVNKRKGLTPDPYYSFIRIIEETGEVARQIFSKRVRPEKYNEEDFKEEIIDVIIELLYFSSFYDIPLEEEISKKLKKIKEKELGSSVMPR